ncbi:Sensor histidine kinase RcsC [Pseudoalteromonas sp. CIP111854]|uniref:histidine kinase n=1 Tax=Pseudoalteromonas holothuriae TaxID=2963714 RepID=A0A9W4QVZ6_9GAMM|nr:response regulator [Pseudoalteromonas sp. CIP111854]CAH9055440.1 Sensor histidine kinase RcsC [Pseudoalteromonas sp. CIP111854]
MLKIIKAVRVRYIFALLAMALLVSMAAGLMQFLLFEKQQDAKIINIAGMQRMLSQKVLLKAHRLASISESTVAMQSVNGELQTSINLFAQNHEFLVDLNAEGNFFSEQLNRWYFSKPVMLDQRSREFVQRIRNFQPTEQRELNELYMISQALLVDLDRAVQLFEQQSNQGVQRLRYVESGIWLLAMLLLILEAKLIFRPMEAQILAGINELKFQKNETEQALSIKSRFLARASHELRTPLQSILGYLDLYRQERQVHQLEQAVTSANQLNVLINEMHDFSRWSNEKIKIQNSYAKLKTTIEMVAAPYKLSAQKKGLTLTVQMDGIGNTQLQCDHQHLAWVCSQLIDNAIKFNDSGEILLVVKVHTLQMQAYLKIQVIDQGFGFDEELLSTLNDHEKIDNHFQGMQLGLVRCQWLVNAMSGEFKFFNRPNGGACVSFSIPVILADNGTSERQINAHGAKALLVEDNAINAVILQKQLSNLGFDVQHVSHGKAAVEILASRSFDVIFMDLNMPYMDGYEAIDHIRTMLTLDITIIVVTANDEPQDIAKAIRLGANEYIVKPLQQDKLTDMLLRLGVISASECT